MPYRMSRVPQKAYFVPEWGALPCTGVTGEGEGEHPQGGRGGDGFADAIIDLYGYHFPIFLFLFLPLTGGRVAYNLN